MKWGKTIEAELISCGDTGEYRLGLTLGTKSRKIADKRSQILIDKFNEAFKTSKRGANGKKKK